MTQFQPFIKMKITDVYILNDINFIYTHMVFIALNKGEDCKTKTRPGILWPEKARSNCTRQLHRIVFVECTWLAVYCCS